MAKRKQQVLKISELPVLTKDNIRVGMKIMMADHPEWDVFWVKQDRNGYIYSRGGADSAMLWESEFHFWRVLPDDCYDLDSCKVEA